MKNLFKLFLVMMVSLTMFSCTTNYHVKNGKIPPGKHKKLHGDKSAKKYAPGQRKNAVLYPSKQDNRHDLFPGSEVKAKKAKKEKKHKKPKKHKK